MPDVVSAREAARLLGLSDTTIRKRIANGSLHATKQGTTWRIPLSEVERLREPVRDPSREPNALRDERDELRAEVKRLHARMEHLETLNERLTILLSNEQAGRLQALPMPSRPFGRLRQLFAR